MQCIYNKFVDTEFELRGQTFEWDSEKAAINLHKHNVTFQEACEVFFDPFFCLVDSTAENEAREGAIGYSERSRLLFVVHVVRQEETIRIISARAATTEERKIYEHE
jgi:uncharacterized DUF497 family protein